MMPDLLAFDPGTAAGILLSAAVAGALYDPAAGAYRAIRRRAWYALDCPPSIPRAILRRDNPARRPAPGARICYALGGQCGRAVTCCYPDGCACCCAHDPCAFPAGYRRLPYGARARILDGARAILRTIRG